MTAEALTREALDEIRHRNRANLDAGFVVDAHSHGERGCRCLSCRVYTGAVITLESGFDCDDQPEAERACDGGCTESILPGVDADNLVKSVEDVRVLLAEINRLRADAGRKERSVSIMRKLLSLAHIKES